jgi:hypothetical protein
MEPMDKWDLMEYEGLRRLTMSGWQVSADKNMKAHGFKDPSPRRQEIESLLTLIVVNATSETHDLNVICNAILAKLDAEETDHQRARRLLLLIGEVSEAYEELRAGHAPADVYYHEQPDGTRKPEGYGIELADVALRLADIAESDGLDLGGLMAEKHVFNEKRPYKHGKKF